MQRYFPTGFSYLTFLIRAFFYRHDSYMYDFLDGIYLLSFLRAASARVGS